MWIVLDILFWVALFYGILAIGIYLFQGRFMYFPNREHIDPRTVGLDHVEELKLDTPDGQTIISWYAPAAPSKPTILYFHGNAGHLSKRRERVLRFTRAGYGIMMMSYRGYSGSSGKPNQAWNTMDGLMAYDTLLDKGVLPEEIIVYGESLGTGIATPVAVSREVAALILEAPFYSTVDIAKSRYPYFPVRRFMIDRYESGRTIHKVTAPILVIHGEQDEMIPLESGQKLFAEATEPKRMKIIPDAGHAHLMRHGAWEEIQNFVEEFVVRKMMAMKEPKVSAFKRKAHS